MLGSQKRALEAQGYSVNIENRGGNSGNSHSSSLSLFISDVNSAFTITIKYFYNRYTSPGKTFPQFIIVARVTLESISGHGSQKYQDGPYVLNWADSYYEYRHGQNWNSSRSPIYLTTPTGDVFALGLGLDRAWVSEYYLVVNLKQSGRYNPTIEPPWHQAYVHDPSELACWLVAAHDHVSLTLPTHTKCALETHGYEVHFEGSQDNPYRLTLSKGNVIIHIDYQHRLSTSPDGQQRLTFSACVTASASESSQDVANDAATQPRRETVEWEAWQSETRDEYGDDEGAGWRWTLKRQDVKLGLPNGRTLKLHLGLHLVWLSEYCVTVQATVSKQPRGKPMHESPGSSHESVTKGENREAETGEDVGTQESPTGESDEE